MTLQPHEGGNDAEPLDQKQRNPSGLRASLPSPSKPYGIGAAWAVRNRVKMLPAGTRVRLDIAAIGGWRGTGRLAFDVIGQDGLCVINPDDAPDRRVLAGRGECSIIAPDGAR
ncbi:hypothetical protein [Acidiphilium acidophilum]|uniref:Uncharacterized protein n=1 Tax=Acidiphilium acidophilum TaxID=76588 RepID=A0AAW9DUK5_ACIAO|nr:hypothetical protein [Acidiphilium acidophilum]MDX5931835.1 hypothetical protein [Acidiphilium acidophilum]GBR75895.1 hypothetical protein AA700_0516 [Acidiphilium acidophilum DSM 700]